MSKLVDIKTRTHMIGYVILVTYYSSKQYGYIITLIKRRKNKLIKWLFISTNLNRLTQGCFVPSLVEIGPVVLKKKIFPNFVNVFSLFRKYLS